MLQGKEPFDSAALWERHGQPVSPDYFAEWQETRQALRSEFEDVLMTPSSIETRNEANATDDNWNRHESAMMMTPKQAIKKLGEKVALPAIAKEIKQMLDKAVWKPMHWERLSVEQRKSMISSSMFLKEKFYADGNFEKLKARLVAGGHLQDRQMYQDISSPTVRTFCGCAPR